MLGLTGELFAVALLLLSIVPAVLTTDSATMEIKMDSLSQRDTHVGLKVTGISSLVLPFKPCEHPGLHSLSLICYIVSQISITVCSRPGEFMLLRLVKHALTGSFSLLTSLAGLQLKVKALAFVRRVPATLRPPFPGQPTSLVPPSQA